MIRVPNSLDPDQARHSVGPDLGPSCLQKLSADNTGDKVLISIMILIIVNSHRTGINCTECVCVNHVLMDFPIWFDIINLGWSIVYIQVSQVCFSFSDNNSHLSKQCRSFHQSLHCLPKYSLRSHHYK